MADDPQDPKQPYTTPHEDPEIERIERELFNRSNKHPEVERALRQGDPNWINIKNRVHQEFSGAEWDRYVILNPEKARAYASQHPEIAQAVKRYDEFRESRQDPASQPPQAPPANQQTTIRDATAILERAAEIGYNNEQRAQERIDAAAARGQQQSVESRLVEARKQPAHRDEVNQETFTERLTQAQNQPPPTGVVNQQTATERLAQAQAQGGKEAPLPGESQAMRDARERIIAAGNPTLPAQEAASAPEQSQPRQNQKTQSPPQRRGPRTVLKSPTRVQRIAGKGLAGAGLAFAGAQLAGGLGDNPNMSQPVYSTYYSPQEFSVLRRELPGLRQGTAEWARLTTQFPELQALRDAREFEEWRREHPEIPSSAWDSHNAAMKYSQYFPDGFQSEQEFQNQVMDHEKREKERSQQEETQHKAEKQQMWQHMMHLPHTPIINRYFMSDRMDQDPEFRKVVERLRAEHDSKNPGDRVQGNTFTRAKDGTVLISENVLAAIPDIQQRANELFAKEKPRLAKRYRKAKRDVLTDHSRYNPEIDEIYKRADRMARHDWHVEEAKFQRDRRTNPRLRGPDFDEIHQSLLTAGLTTFINDPKRPQNAKLAKAYAKRNVDFANIFAEQQKHDEEALKLLTQQFHNDPEIQAALKEIEQQTQTTLAEERRKKTADPNYIERSERQIRDEAEERVFSRYVAKNPAGAALYAHAVGGEYPGMARAFASRKQAQIRSGKTPEQIAREATAPIRSATPQPPRSQGGPTVTPGLNRLSTAPSSTTQPTNAPRFTPSAFGRNMGGRVGNEPSPQPATRRLPRRRPRLRAPLGGANPIGGPAGRLVGSLVKQGIFAFFRTPPGMVVLAVILIIFLFISILVPAGSYEEEAEASENVPVAVEVTKVGDEAVGNNETITYTLTVNPTGSPTDIRVVDELPENAEFVSANPCPNVQTETRLEWLLSSLGNCGSDQPNSPTSSRRPSARGTIHDLGIAEINGSQMDALIRRINANSPLIGQGATIVRYADEFNVDPLLFFISINESQLCADTGVVSPGGSDPDNYNCAGITWAAVDGVDGNGVLDRDALKRWGAKEGPYANDRSFTFVGTPENGIGLFFNYVGVHPRYQNRTPQQFYDIYNPCADSNLYGYACGAEEMDNILSRVRNALQAEGVNASSLQAAATFSPVTIQVILRPKEGDTYIDNQAFAEVIE